MYVSEDSFTHLRQAADERQLRELEFRRRARERVAATTASAPRRGLRGVLLRLRVSPRPAPRRFSHT